MIDGNLYESIDEIDSGSDPKDSSFYIIAKNTSDLGALRDMWEQVRQTIAAARQLEAAIGDRLAQELGNGSARFGDTIYTVTRAGSRNVKDPDGFWEWAGTLENVSDLAAMLSLNGIRITAVRAVAEKNGYEAETIEEAFFEWVPKEDAEPRAVAIPISKARVWQRGLKEGEHRARQP